MIRLIFYVSLDSGLYTTSYVSSVTSRNFGDEFYIEDEISHIKVSWPV